MFASKAQVKLIEYLLENRRKIFNQASLARFLGVSPSTVARVAETLVHERILLFERFDRGMKIMCLNEEEEKTRFIIEFYEKIKNL